MRAILLSLLLVGCASHPIAASEKDVTIYRPAPDSKYVYRTSGCFYMPGQYFKIRAGKAGVDIPFQTGSAAIRTQSGDYIRVGRAPESGFWVKRFLLTRVPADQAKKEMVGMVETCK